MKLSPLPNHLLTPKSCSTLFFSQTCSEGGDFPCITAITLSFIFYLSIFYFVDIFSVVHVVCQPYELRSFDLSYYWHNSCNKAGYKFISFSFFTLSFLAFGFLCSNFQTSRAPIAPPLFTTIEMTFFSKIKIIFCLIISSREDLNSTSRNSKQNIRNPIIKKI